MGEDAFRVLEKYLKLLADIRQHVGKELPQVQSAAVWARRLPDLPKTGGGVR
jgi:hypothetical protein